MYSDISGDGKILYRQIDRYKIKFYIERNEIDIVKLLPSVL